MKPSERDNILQETQWLRKRIKEDCAKIGQNTEEAKARLQIATVYYVYYSFGINLLYREFPNDSRFKKFLLQYLSESHLTWKTEVAIGLHFKYDAEYLKFLDKNNYPISSGQRSEMTDISVQLNELEAAHQRPVGTPDQLLKLFTSGEVKETTSDKDRQANGNGEAMEATGDQPSSDEPKPEPESSEPEPGANPQTMADIHFNKQLQSLVFKVNNFAAIDARFRDLLQLRPPSSWDAVRKEYLKEALLKAGMIANSLVKLLP